MTSIRIIMLYVIAMTLLIWTAQGVSPVLADTTTERIDPDTAESHALVIGVGDYAHWARHTQAAANAEKVTQLLEQGGFDVKLLLNLTSADLKKAFEQLIHHTSKKPECRIVVYYCGWGETQTLDNGKQAGWIIPRDCPRVDDDATGFRRSAVSTHTLDMYVRQMQARHVIMLLDAALSGELFDLSTPTLRPKVQQSLEPVRQYIIAATPGETIYDQNLFADTLIQGLQGEADAVWDGYISGSELGVYFFNRISRESKGKQHPQYGKSVDATLARGDFIFQKIDLGLQGRLFVNCQPSSARVRILNIKPKFQQGMLLAPGRYHVEASAEGYISQRRWIQIKAGQAAKFEPRLQKIELVIVNDLKMAMVWIKAGSFTMGSPLNEPGKQENETAHTVGLSKGFRMQRTEVTVGQFKRFVKKTGYQTEAEKSDGCWVQQPDGRWQRKSDCTWRTAGPWMTTTKGAKIDLYPVTCVSWNDAMAFAQWLSRMEGKTYRLPTEAQWEMACRAGTQTPFAFGKCPDKRSANYAAAGKYYAHCSPSQAKNTLAPLPAASLKKNKWGLFDMHGNMAEWCWDWYDTYSSQAQSDPQGPVSGTERVIRGGHFISTADQCRSAKRSSFLPAEAANVIGFRLVQLP